MKKVSLFLFVAILATSCNAQNPKPKDDNLAKTRANNKYSTVPKGSWKVNKELDENGNIIRYDSIYSWSSSKNLQDLSHIEKDSLLKEMHFKMQQQFSMFKTQGYFNLMESDSIMDQFFSDDFFTGKTPNNSPNMEDLMIRMEAMRQQFFDNRHRYIIPPEKIQEKSDLKKKSI